MIVINETDTRFYISKSSQPRAEKGVFATEPIKKGEFLEIIGVMAKVNSIVDQCTSYADTYKFASNYEDNYDYIIIPMGFAAIINHANDPKDQNVKIAYTQHPKRNSNASKAIYQFIRDVDKDEEILGDYGKNWSKVFEWAKQAPELANSVNDEWAKFLKYGLYNLDKLLEEIPYE